MAVVSTVVAVVVIIIQLFIEKPSLPEPWYPNPTVGSFSLGFGAILFAFGGSAVFPTVQNDMKERSQFWKSALVGFAGGQGGPAFFYGLTPGGVQVQVFVVSTKGVGVEVEVYRFD